VICDARRPLFMWAAAGMCECALRHGITSRANGSFCRGKWQDVAPEDKDLKRYHAWLKAHNGQDSGFERDVLL
jgi:hypothetical protein